MVEDTLEFARLRHVTPDAVDNKVAEPGMVIDEGLAAYVNTLQSHKFKLKEGRPDGWSRRSRELIMTATTQHSRMGLSLSGGYGPAMAAEEALTRVLSAELAPQGIRVVGRGHR